MSDMNLVLLVAGWSVLSLLVTAVLARALAHSGRVPMPLVKTAPTSLPQIPLPRAAHDRYDAHAG